MDINVILLFIIGLFFGSLFTKIGYRLPQNVSLFTNSRCNSCNADISFFDKIPVISFLLLKGRCRNCHHRISLMYPFFELLTGVIFSLCYLTFIKDSYPVLTIIFGLLFLSTLIIVTISDIKYMVIPDEVLLLFGMILIILRIFIMYKNELVLSFLDAGYEIIFMIIEAVVMYLIMDLIKRIGDIVLRKYSLGQGDVKLMAFIAMIMGWRLCIAIIFIASFFALPISIIRAYKKSEQMLPFGPYIALAAIILFLININFDTLISYIH